jgi:hypothetical protein
MSLKILKILDLGNTLLVEIQKGILLYRVGHRIRAREKSRLLIK